MFLRLQILDLDSGGNQIVTVVKGKKSKQRESAQLQQRKTQ
jgi:hypothetical protein